MAVVFLGALNDPLLARLLAAATAGAPPAGPAHKCAPVRILLDPDATPVAKGKLCGQQAGFNLHAQCAPQKFGAKSNLCPVSMGFLG